MFFILESVRELQLSSDFLVVGIDVFAKKKKKILVKKVLGWNSFCLLFPRYML